MKTIQAKDMTDEQWQSFAKLMYFLKQEFNPQFWDGRDSDWKKIKIARLNKVSITDNAFSNSYYIVNHDKVSAFIDAYDGNGNLNFHYNYEGKHFTSDIVKMILNVIRNLLNKRNKNEAFFGTFYKRHCEPLLKIGAEIYSESLISRLLKKDVDFLQLAKITESNNYINNYELKLFREIPEEIHHNYLDCENEASIGINEFRPIKRKASEYTMNDLLTRIRNMKNVNEIFYMYVIFDKEEIAALCSVSIFMIDKKPFIEHTGNLTFVRRKYRGKGFAKYLKAKMYLKILQDYPDFELILTDTYPWNKYMYKINEELGFKPYQKGYKFKFTKEFLENFTNEN